jgi:hypothetical protein
LLLAVESAPLDESRPVLAGVSLAEVAKVLIDAGVDLQARAAGAEVKARDRNRKARAKWARR